jgi:hypothetical protein
MPDVYDLAESLGLIATNRKEILMRILRQLLSLVLVFVLAFPAFGRSEAIGQTVYSQTASVREAPLVPRFHIALR